MTNILGIILCVLGAFMIGFQMPEIVTGQTVNRNFRTWTGLSTATLTLGICLMGGK